VTSEPERKRRQPLQGSRYNVHGVRNRRQSSYYYKLVIALLVCFDVDALLYVSVIPPSSSSGAQLHLETCTNNIFYIWLTGLTALRLDRPTGQARQ